MKWLWIVSSLTPVFASTSYNACEGFHWFSLHTASAANRWCILGRRALPEGFSFTNILFPDVSSLSYILNYEAPGGNCHHWDDMSHLEFDTPPPRPNICPKLNVKSKFIAKGLGCFSVKPNIVLNISLLLVFTTLNISRHVKMKLNYFEIRWNWQNNIEDRIHGLTSLHHFS